MPSLSAFDVHCNGGVGVLGATLSLEESGIDKEPPFLASKAQGPSHSPSVDNKMSLNLTKIVETTFLVVRERNGLGSRVPRLTLPQLTL